MRIHSVQEQVTAITGAESVGAYATETATGQPRVALCITREGADGHLTVGSITITPEDAETLGLALIKASVTE